MIVNLKVIHDSLDNIYYLTIDKNPPIKITKKQAKEIQDNTNKD